MNPPATSDLMQQSMKLVVDCATQRCVVIGTYYTLRRALASCPQNTPGMPAVILGDDAPPHWVRPGDCMILLLTVDQFVNNPTYTKVFVFTHDMLDITRVPADAVHLEVPSCNLPDIVEVNHECTAWAGAPHVRADIVVWWDKILCKRARGTISRGGGPHYTAAEIKGQRGVGGAVPHVALVGGTPAEHRLCLKRLVDAGYSISRVSLHTFEGKNPVLIRRAANTMLGLLAAHTEPVDKEQTNEGCPTNGRREPDDQVRI